MPETSSSRGIQTDGIVRWCGFCGEPVRGGANVCPSCNDLPALDLAYATSPLDLSSATGSRIEGSRILYERVGLFRVVEEPEPELEGEAVRDRVWTLASLLAIAVLLALVWIGLATVVRWATGWAF